MQVHAAFVFSLANAHCLLNRNEVDVNWHSLIHVEQSGSIMSNFKLEKYIDPFILSSLIDIC